MNIFVMCKTFPPVYNSAKIIKIHQDFPKLWSQMFCHLFMVHSVYFITVYCSQLQFVNCFCSFSEWMNEWIGWMEIEANTNCGDTACNQNRTKTTETTITKLATATAHRDSPSWVLVTHLIAKQKVKSQGHMVTKYKTYWRRSSGRR